MSLKRINATSARPSLVWAALACMLSFSCAHSAAEAGGSGSTGGSGSSGGGGYTLSDLDGEWVGVLYPNSNVLDPFNFYFISADDGVVSDGADSKGNRWLAEDSEITDEILSSGRMMVKFNSMISVSRLFLDGNMNPAMNELTGDYEYLNAYGIPIRGTFILSRSTGKDYFAGLDYAGSWSGGFGVGHNENMRQLEFVLAGDGTVISGSMTHRVTGHEIHHYSLGAGSFAATNTRVGRIDNVVLTADDGAIAECDFLLLDHELTLVGGTGVDSEVGEGRIEIIRD
jgi:hypothetical protein